MTPPTCCASAEGEGDRITTYRQGDAIFINVRSERGIGRGRVQCAGSRLPETVIVRLHLRGLEHLGVSAGDVTVNASVASHGDHAIHQSAMRPGDATPHPIVPSDPYWLTIASRDGRFDVTLPPALIAGDQLTLEWVDFYR